MYIPMYYVSGLVTPQFVKNHCKKNFALTWRRLRSNYGKLGAWRVHDFLQKMKSPRVSVWCKFLAGEWSDRTSSRICADGRKNINVERYRNMITNFLPELDDMDFGDMWFQQDDTTCHIAYETNDLLKDWFTGRPISKRCDVEWHHRSCNLATPDFSLWGFDKGNVYANNPQIISDPKHSILYTIIMKW